MEEITINYHGQEVTLERVKATDDGGKSPVSDMRIELVLRKIWHEDDYKKIFAIMDEYFPDCNMDEAKEIVNRMRFQGVSVYGSHRKWLDYLYGWANKKEEVDGFDAELNALLKKYEHLSKKELQEPLEFYLGVVRDDLDIVREEKPKWTDEDERIRKALMWFVEQFPYERLENNGVSVKEALAWLEKQAPK